MYGKSLLILASIFTFLITYTFFTGTLDLRSQFFPIIQSQASNPTTCLPLRVFMYNLPPKFHVDMIRHQDYHNSHITSQNMPTWPSNTGLKRQHSVEFWLMASLLINPNSTRFQFVRVLDPENADVFFVPFFSSLSFNTHGHNMTDLDTEVDRQLQIEIVNILKQSKYWQKSGGRDHVIPMHHPNAFRFLREEVNASILIVSDFGRYPKTLSNLNKDVVAPYVHMVDSLTDDELPDPFESRTTLLFFRGRTVRKDEGIVRAKLAKLLVGYDDVHYEQSYATAENIKASTRGMRSSKFCLNPAGDTPSSCRLFDAIVSHCIPVIVSDQIELPFEDELDYSKFSIFFSMEKALKHGHMVDQLRKVPKEKWVEMWARIKNVSKHYEFQYPPKRGDAVDMIWSQVKHKLPGVNLGAHRSRRLKVPDWWTRKR